MEQEKDQTQTDDASDYCTLGQNFKKSILDHFEILIYYTVYRHSQPNPDSHSMRARIRQGQSVNFIGKFYHILLKISLISNYFHVFHDNTN